MDPQTELRQRLSEIGTHVDLAAAAGTALGAAPALASALERLKELADRARQLVLSDQRESELADCLAALEAAAEQARGLCHAQPHRHDVPAATLEEAWQEIRDLRRQVDR